MRSVARSRSAVDVEQLLGRVLRMPYAARRRLPDLDRAYAFVSESFFGASAYALADTLVAMRFGEDKTHESIELAEPGLGESGDPTDRHAEKTGIWYG